MKKFLSILLVLTMVLSLGITAFADEGTGSNTGATTGSITIKNATKNETYRIYKIFDATYDGDAVSYTIDPENNPLFPVLFGTDGKTENTYFNYTASSNAVAKKQSVNDSEVVAYLTKLIVGDPTATPAVPPVVTVREAATAQVASDKTVVFEDLPYGYYLISRDQASAVTIDSNNPNATVIDKNQKPATGFDKQVVTGALNDVLANPNEYIFSDSNTANIGDMITYKVSFNATNYDGDQPIKYYQMNDTKGDGIWIEFNSFKVSVNGTPLKHGYYLPVGDVHNTGNYRFLGDWSDIAEQDRDRNDADWYLVHLGEDQFRISIPWIEDHSISGDEAPASPATPGPYTMDFDPITDITDVKHKFESPALVEIYYEATLEANASIGNVSNTNLSNTAVISWGTMHDVFNSELDRVETRTFGLGVVKEDSADHENLSGAIFKLYRDEALTTPVNVIPTNIDGVYIIDSEGAPCESMSDFHAIDSSRALYASSSNGGDAKLAAYLNGQTVKNEIVSQVNGRIVVLGLDSGEYWLVETKAPDGYNALSRPQKLVVGENLSDFTIFANANGAVADLTQPENGFTEQVFNVSSIIIQNSQGTELPSTGGVGTFWLITIGTLLAIGFAVFLITHKKMSVYTD